ncbi:hypothetical protein B7P43_G04371 [Cryptotermes secundus]|uniref:Ionotropic glutamate receptor C-terminal domain-containing protein n=1 Tax=Cryptotermes secundus TaxID=105785 RepID=A0A2J7QC88_9NEOP|nr:hypothetical protein B7P43_G04371 [Cryptotermes secundus]
MVLLSVFMQTSGQVQRHAIQCLVEISSRHLTSAHALVVSYNSAQFQDNQSTVFGKECRNRRNAFYLEIDFVDKLLCDLQESEKWLSLVYFNNMNEMPQNRHGSYMIISMHHHRQTVVQDISAQVKRLRSGWNWNPRAKFVISVTNAQVNSTEELVADLFAELWRWRVVNAIVLSPAPGPYNATQLEVYTWFPYHPPGRCGNVRDAVVLDRWIVDERGNGNFLYNASLFPEKVPNDLQSCPIIASVFELQPAVMSKRGMAQGSVSAHTVFNEGIEIRLLQELAKSSNMSIEYTQPSMDELWGVPLENGSWSGTSGQLIQGSVDVAMDFYFYRCDVIKETECLTPHLIDKVRWYVPCAAPYPGWMSLIRVFTLSLWLGFLASYFIVAVAMWQVVKISNKMFVRPTENQAYTNLTKCLINFWAVILGESAPNNPPQEPVIRAVFLIWILYCLAINTVYQTYLTTFLVDPGLEHQLGSEDEVINSGMEYGIPSTIATVITDLTGYRYRNLLYCDDHKACQNRIAFKRDFSYIYSTMSMEFIIAARYMDGNGKQLICSFEEIISSQLITMPVPKGYVMLDRFNKIILHLLQAGIIDQWFRDIKYTTFLSSTARTTLSRGEYIKLSLMHMQSAVYILLLGIILSLIVFLSEILFCRNLHPLHS